jgi:hypothetical protein
MYPIHGQQYTIYVINRLHSDIDDCAQFLVVVSDQVVSMPCQHIQPVTGLSYSETCCLEIEYHRPCRGAGRALSGLSDTERGMYVPASDANRYF